MESDRARQLAHVENLSTAFMAREMLAEFGEDWQQWVGWAQGVVDRPF